MFLGRPTYDTLGLILMYDIGQMCLCPLLVTDPYKEAGSCYSLDLALQLMHWKHVVFRGMCPRTKPSQGAVLFTNAERPLQL